ncbi:MAG: hypothetical protein ACFCVH_03085 [Alphaproteobacteria bacterium]
MRLSMLSAAALLAVSTLTLEAHAEGRLSGWRQNGPDGGWATGLRGGVSDGNGAGAFGSVGCAAGPAGRACRAGATTVDGNGTVNHRSGFVAQGANGGSASSQGGFVRNPDGTWAGGRSTDLTGANGSYAGQTTWSSQTGVTHIATCLDPYGKTIPCPTR